MRLQMSKSNQPDINQLVLKAHKRGIKKAIEASARSNTSMVICENGKIKSIPPKYKYVLVPVDPLKKKSAPRTRSIRKKR